MIMLGTIYNIVKLDTNSISTLNYLSKFAFDVTLNFVENNLSEKDAKNGALYQLGFEWQLYLR